MFGTLLSLGLLAQVVSDSTFSADGCTFEDTYAFSSVECFITVRNPTDTTVHITAESVEPEGAIFPAKIDIPANTEASLKVRANTGNSSGEFSRFFNLKEVTSRKTIKVRANGFALSVLDEPSPRVLLGRLDAAAEKPKMRIAIDSHEVADFRVLKIIEKPIWTSVNLVEGGRAINVELQPGAPWGRLDGIIKLALNAPHQTEAWVDVKAEVDGEVRAKENRFWMGILTEEKKANISIPLESVSKNNKKFKFGTVTLEEIDGEGKVVPCVPSRDGCALLKIDLSRESRGGVVQGVVSVDLPAYSRQLRIMIWGILNGASKESGLSMASKEDIGGSKAEPSSLSPGDASPRKAAESDASTSIVSSGGEPKRKGGAILKWSVMDDGGAYGYQIFRSEKKDGPFLLVNPKLVHANGQANGLSKYQWRDESAEINHAYWYYIGVVGKDGSKRRLSEPQKKSISDE